MINGAPVNVLDYGAIGNGIADDTAAVQAAIDTGSDVIFPEGTYLANNLTQSTNFQRFYSIGQVNVNKNANGVLLTSTGNYVEFNGIQFFGDSTTGGFTGNNVNSSGSHPRFINCASYDTPGRALLATGAHVQILGTCSIYATTDATATGYDIEIGVSGTATLYHQLVGVYTSQAAGGIKLIDTGSHVITGGQFGKLTIAAGTSPSGVNGGMTANARILGAVSVEMSNAVFTGNQFSGINVDFAAGTAGCTLDASNIFGAGATVTNSGNANNVIVRNASAGSTIQLKYGSDTFNRTITMDGSTAGTGFQFDGALVLPNTYGIKIKDFAGTTKNAVSLTASDDYIFGTDTGANYLNIESGSGGVYANVSGVNVTQTTTNVFKPTTDNAATLGGASNRWSTVYAGTGTINTSDARLKQQIRTLSDAEQAVAVRCKTLLRAFKFNDAVEAKGDNARIHFGVVAQDVMAAFESEGLNASDYALFCYDRWEEQGEILRDDGMVMQPYAPAGDRYGIRYEELLAFIISAL
tara:strand:+ start:428 stop:1999 length:1572 start_codon:yes stop_codon:yes gene_type:complete